MEQRSIGAKQNKLLAAVLMLLPAVLILYFLSGGVIGNDFWWHVKAGEYIWQHHTVPTADIFSWFGMEQNLAWTAHEWLSEVVLYAIFSLAGKVGVFLFCAVSSLLLTGLVFSLNRRDSRRNTPLATLFFICFALSAYQSCVARPQTFSYFFLLAELKLLFDFTEDPSRRRIWFLPLVAVLWSNFHGGSSNLAYLLPLMFLAVGCLRFDLGRIHAGRLDRRGLVTLLLVAFCCAAAIFVNPIGWKVFLYPYQSIGDSVSMAAISEWASPDAKKIAHLLFFFVPMALFSSVLLIEKDKPVRLIDLAVFAFFTFLFLRSVRFGILWFVAAPFFLFRYFPRYDLRLPESRFSKVFLATALTCCVSMCVIAGVCTAATAVRDELVSVALNDEAVAAVKADAPQRPYTSYNYGETLIYNGIPTFVDARADLFSSCGALGDEWDMESVTPKYHGDDEPFSVETLIRKYRFDAFLTPNSTSLAVYMESHPERFRLVYRDDEVVYYRLIGAAE